MPIPTHVTRTELDEALKPLCDLLGTSVKNIYSSPGITIGASAITFNVPVRHEEAPTTRADSTRTFAHPQGDEHAEFVFAAHVEVV